MKREDVDRILRDWDSRPFNTEDVRRRRGKIECGPTGLVIKRSTSAPSGGAKPSASRARQKLSAVARRVPEVMVKISGGGTGMRQIKAHFDYISRNGQISLEDQDGLVTTDHADIGALRHSWQNGGYPVPEEGRVREAFNIVLSMPEGTDEVALKRAACDFAAEHFRDHQYAMALHTFDTDPDPTPARHPHVHLVVKARSDRGVRLNPRKADLARWRESFARALGDHGVEAVASLRQLRQQGDRGVAIGTLKQRARTGEGAGRGDRVKSPVNFRSDQSSLIDALSRSEDREDRRLAVALQARFRSGPDRGR
ncbi:hypothetical protein [Asticcacaulis sp. YBE204]|uniref:relaxase/mobilization nuclease domain-containing protein n=1 Tax=Asticcacaulis sp. YBE204 TaxID=1282363 RepID=UPI0003C404E7|nr:hypothetical protein [Asticcacaulis sp. YBE204]ESQ79253.1 hypothetical protein AEYBE204_09595 [Asticcacaulis sp. YBE204]